MRQRNVYRCWAQGAVTLKAATGAQKFFQKLATIFQLSACVWKQRRGRKKKHEAEKCISLLGAGGRHPEGRYGGTKVFPKAGNHFSSDRLNVAAEGWPLDLLTYV